MTMTRRRRITCSVLAILVLAGGFVFPRAVTEAVADESGVAATMGGCPVVVGCGGGCEARLSVGVCMLAVEWKGAIKIGPVQIGPSIELSCEICECWYTYTSQAGYEIFKRTTKMSCSGSAPEVELIVA